MKNFAMLGAAGFVAPRHMRAIKDTGNALVAACDPYDGVGILDSHFPDCRFFTEVERFDRHLEKLRRRGEGADYVSICSPNYLHDAHCRLALRIGAHAICEKPLVISPWNLDPLAQIEAETGKKIYTVLQLRLHDEVRRLKATLEAQQPRQPVDIELTYVTRRGPWYHHSWKGQPEKSGTLAMNIGIHFFDMLLWLFGPVEESAVHLRTDTRMAGDLKLRFGRVRWFLSVDRDDLPPAYIARGLHAYRGLKMGDVDFDFSTGFTDLHTRVYQDILEGGGYGIEDARPSIELVHAIRNAQITPCQGPCHPLLVKDAHL
ncbi:Gfo/Idh/MocA family oxidoreductase [Myxococcota bacterium]|nr:Gfo/Idh/MocA family oxidoreductase [Myxococcota bacterium]MBU1432451.1 Gfo/Idh/MocA family oxidoreductase [Myxococcota bacterium]MBU1896638.1 Gfo/Idh/MocA family oxidoreductase [Myxococcota bacterium]